MLHQIILCTQFIYNFLFILIEVIDYEWWRKNSGSKHISIVNHSLLTTSVTMS